MIGQGVLITRPEPGAAETARLVAALGWQPVLAPALLLTPRHFTFPRVQALLLTSRAAARALPLLGLPPDLPILTVGEETAAEARGCNFRDVTAATGDAAGLAVLVATRLHPAKGPLLLAIGRGYGAGLATTLRAQGFSVLRRVAYDATPAATLPPAAQAALRQGGIGAALFFSPRSAQSAMALLQAAGLAATAGTIRALAISGRVAEALAALPWREVQVAARPDQSRLLALLGSY